MSLAENNLMLLGYNTEVAPISLISIRHWCIDSKA